MSAEPAGPEVAVDSRSSGSMPGWLHDAFGDRPLREVKIDSFCVEIAERAPVSLLRLSVPNAGSLPSDEFRRTVQECYLAVFRVTSETNGYPIRFWNYVPGISRRRACGLSGYELFNSGRFEAFEKWQDELVPDRLAAASAVGAATDALTLHVLTGSKPARGVGNPRQIPPYRYSQRYGPVPPVFARGCRLSSEQTRALGCGGLVSGTASIRGEDTRHRGDLPGQLDEAIVNLAAVSDVVADVAADSAADALARYLCLRAYVPRAEHDSAVRDRLRVSFPQIAAVELVRADLCRPDLLVEIEGTLSPTL